MPRRKRKYEEFITMGFDDSGRRIRKYIGADKKDEFERLKKAAINEAERIRRPSEITLGEYADKWYETYKANYTIQTRNEYKYAKDKLKPIRLIRLKDVTSSDLQRIINQHADHPRSCQQLKSTMCQIWRQAIKDGLVYPINIAEDLSLPHYKSKERRIISDSEMEKIMKADFQEQDFLYMETLRSTGMRPSEALALQWTDIDFAALTIRVCRSFEFQDNWPVIKATKTYKDRIVPITSEFAAMLRDSPKSGVFVFTYGDGQPMSKSVYRKMSQRILKRINIALGGTDKLKVIGNMTMYSFRHTYATNLYYNAVKPGIISAKKAAQIMGHSEEMFIKRYTHLDDDKEQMNALRDVLAGRQKGDKKETQLPEKGPGRQKGDRKKRLKAVRIGKSEKKKNTEKTA